LTVRTMSEAALTADKHTEKVLGEQCENCGSRLKQYPVREDGRVVGHDVGCPNFFRSDGCSEVVREVRE